MHLQEYPYRGYNIRIVPTQYDFGEASMAAYYAEIYREQMLVDKLGKFSRVETAIALARELIDRREKPNLLQY